MVAGDELGLALAEELERLAPFGIANPSVSLLVPAARLVDARPMGEEGRHVRFTVEAGGHRARAVAFGMSRLPDGDVHDATFTLELNEWNGAVEPRLVLRHAQVPVPAPVELVGEPEDPVEAALAELAAPLPVAGATSRAAGVPRDRRGEAWPARWPRWWRRASRCWWRPPMPAARRGHLAAPSRGLRRRRVARARARSGADRTLRARAWRSTRRRPTRRPRWSTSAVTLAWGDAEAEYALRAHEAAYDLRPTAASVYRALRDGALPDAVAAAPSPAAAGRALRVLDELGLVRVDGASVTLAPARRTELDASAAFRAYTTRLAEGRARLGAPPRAARAA